MHILNGFLASEIPTITQDLYGSPPITMDKPKVFVIAAIVAAVIMFIIGLVVFLNKKISDTVKRVILILLILLALAGFIVLKIFVL